MSGYSNTAYQEHSEEVSAGHNASSSLAQQDLITPVILERATAHMNIQGTSAAGTDHYIFLYSWPHCDWNSMIYLEGLSAEHLWGLMKVPND